jgi:phosphoadenosine phosphosulfate reductase
MASKDIVNLARPVELNAYEASRGLEDASTEERVDWAIHMFGSGLYCLTSAGADSAVMLDHIAGKNIDAIFINTGFLHPETVEYSHELSRKFGVRIHETGPSQEVIDDVKQRNLDQTDLDEYSRLTKLLPLREKINQLGVTALLTGVRRTQNDHRATLDFVGIGNDREVRINALLDWPEQAISDYIAANGLPSNPLSDRGYGSMGDKQLTQVGNGREGRILTECGIHTFGGYVIRKAS